jgi:cysteine-rich repeat protein
MAGVKGNEWAGALRAAGVGALLLLCGACTMDFGSFQFGPGGAGVGGQGATGGGADGGSTVSSGGTAGGGGGGATGGAPAGGGGAGAAAGAGGAAPACGNGDPGDPGEECDDGGTIAGDRCGPTCLNEHPDTCPGTPIALGADGLTITDTTTGAADDAHQTTGQGACVACYWMGPDLIYAVTPTLGGQLSAELQATYGNHYLVVRSSCPDGGDLDCAYSQNANNTDSVTSDVTAGQTVYVIVDSYQGTDGAFTLQLSLN